MVPPPHGMESLRMFEQFFNFNDSIIVGDVPSPFASSQVERESNQSDHIF